MRRTSFIAHKREPAEWLPRFRVAWGLWRQGYRHRRGSPPPGIHSQPPSPALKSDVSPTAIFLAFASQMQAAGCYAAAWLALPL